MPGYTTIAIEGVLADQGSESSFAASKLLTPGVLVYHGLKNVSKILLVADHQDREKVEHWLKAHGFRDHVDLIFNPVPEDLVRGREELIPEIRRRGGYDLAVESEDRYAARAVAAGVSTLVIAHPAYTRSEFRPDDAQEIQPWNKVVEELDRQRDMHSKDDRITADVAGTQYES